ncbi:serine/threonine-protein kinase [Streptomyces chrestomyceticus]|uniref:serine/threonine-protein kinase n=1 Tax=Streptomyces chrestomyceticus TaxID=68185 RepID=UPI0033E36CF8
MTLIGTLALGRYEVLERRASGTQGELFVGCDIENGNKVAIKLQPPNIFESTDDYAELSAELAQEAANGKRLLGVRGIPEVLGTGYHRNRYCIVMEFVDGVLLGDIVADVRPLKDTATTAAIICQLCQILHEVHRRRLVHRDVKPENIMLAPDGRLWLLDFGFAVEPGVPTPWGSGTAGYAPPEQHDANKDGVTPRADIYALGCILLKMTVMHLPYAGADGRPTPEYPVLPPNVLPLVPAPFRSLALRMVDRRPENRPDAREVFSTLRPLLLTVGTHPPAKPLDPDPTEPYLHGVPSI